MRALVAACAAAAVCFSTSPAVLAAPTPYSPETREAWVNPLARAGESGDLRIDVTRTPDIVHAGEGMRVGLTVSNSSEETVSDLRVTARRGDPTWTVEEARRVLALDTGAYPWEGPGLELPGELRPGERREVTLVLPPEFLPEGTFPLLLQLGETTERMLVTVTPAPAPAGEDVTAPQVPGLTVLLPLTAPVDIVPGETGRAAEDTPLILQSEQLAGQLAPEGRLSGLLDVYATEQRGTCLAVDPALVDTVARMTAGYTVAGERPSLTQKTKRLRDSWFTDDEPDPGVPGRGAADALAWLERLQGAECVVALPWAAADVNAVAATEDEWLFREAVARGPQLLAETLGVTPVTNVVIPPSGYVTEQAASALGWADQPATVEKSWEAAVAQLTPQPTGVGDTALESTHIPDRSGAPTPTSPVRTLVSANSVWGVPRQGNHALIAPGVTAATYPPALGSLLAATGPAPRTTGYSHPDWRFDYRLDSPAARAVTAASAVRLAVREQTLPGNWAQAPQPVLVMPPPLLDTHSATTLLRTVTTLLDDAAATPLALEDALTPPPGLEEQPVAPPTLGVTRFGSPWADPAVVSDTEVLRAAQQTRYTDDLTRIMVNEPAIQLDRYDFTLPLRRDILVALTGASRSSLATRDDAVRAADHRLDANRQTLQELRGSVALIPPGNVYTRASESSPLLIVAENGLPLPVDSDLAYSGPEGATLAMNGYVHIPAHGSITVPLTADLPDESQTHLSLWLATRDGSPISTPVEITVQTRAGIVGTYGVALLIVVGLALALLFRVGRHRRRRRP